MALGLAVWSLYAADHVLDAMRTKRSPWEPQRKMFHKRHWPLMAVLGACSGIGALLLALFSLSRDALALALAIGGFVFAYFVCVHSGPFRWRGYWPREGGVALGFGLGTFVPLVPAGTIPSLTLASASAVFFFLCWLNCCAVETWEWQRCGSPTEETPHASTRWIARHLSTLAICVGTGALLVGRWFGRGSDLGLAGFSSATALFLLAEGQTAISDSLLGFSADLALCAPLLFFTVH